MELEKISNVNSNYSSAEAAKVSAPKQVKTEELHTSQTMTNAVPKTSQPTPAEAKGNAEQQGGDQQREHAPSEATMDDAVKRANLRMEHTRCEYSYHKKTNRVSIKVINSDTNEVVREIPPEKSLDMLQKMWEMAGILVDEKR